MKEAPRYTFLIPDLPIEVGCEIFSYLPVYRFLGYTKVQSVCRAWHAELSRPVYLSRIEQPKRQAILRSSYTSEDALYVLKEPSLYKMLSFSDCLQIAALNESLSWWLINPVRRDFLEITEVINLARPHFALASDLFKDKAFIKRFSSAYEWISLINAHPLLIDEVLRDSSVYLSIQELAFLLRTHLKDREDYLEKLRGFFSEDLVAPELYVLGLASEEFAEKIITTETCVQKLSSADLARLGREYLKIAIKTIENDMLLDKMGEYIYYLFRRKAVAEQALTLDKFKDKIDRFVLSVIAGNHYELAKNTLKDEARSNQLDARDLVRIFHCSTHAGEIFDIISKNKRLLDLLNISHLAKIARYCSKVGKDLLMDKEKAGLLEPYELMDLFNESDLGKIILEDEVLAEKLKENHLICINDKPIGLTEKVLNNEKREAG